MEHYFYPDLQSTALCTATAIATAVISRAVITVAAVAHDDALCNCEVVAHRDATQAGRTA
eukprot:3210-Heterococcus_DN1.PRE.2